MTSSTAPSIPAACLLSAALLTGCTGDDTGQVRLTTWGEEFIEQGIGAEEFEDRSSVRFDRFLIHLGGFSARGPAGELNEARSWLVNLVSPGPHALATVTAASGQYDEIAYTVAPLTDDAELHASATGEDRALMEGGPYSVYVEGEAVHQGASQRFAWGFSDTTEYVECQQEVDGRLRPGFDVGVGGTTPVELTIHGDHLFYDDLASESAVLRFAALAEADADENGEVTLDELAAVSLIELPADTYGTGNFSDVDDLGAFLRALTRTLGHFNGEGHCLPR
jgi:hypothetical protein